MEAGPLRHADASPVERLPVLVYLAELLARTGQHERAVAALAELDGLELDEIARLAVASELATAGEIERELR